MLYKNGVIEETGLAAGVLDHPGNGVVWLANKIAAYDEQLDAGDVVLGGSFTRPTTAGAAMSFASTTGGSARSRSASREGRRSPERGRQRSSALVSDIAAKTVTECAHSRCAAKYSVNGCQ